MNAAVMNLGLSPFFTQQLTVEELESGRLARIIEIQRSHFVASDGTDEWAITLGGAWYQVVSEQRPTVGDWVLLDDSREKIVRLLDRKSIFKRVAAGDKVDVQLLAANVDTLFIVTSCNEEFNESRLERYLALALEAGVDPVVILTKSDLTDNAEDYCARVRSVDADVPVELINAKDVDTLGRLMAWVTSGSTVALVGSSGVGKSTILNSLSETRITETGAIRQQDAKGRHTTSFRSLHRLPGGGILLDLPGIREIKIAQLETSLDSVFEDIDTLAKQCKYSDCAHDKEPGCAVRKAVNDGEIDQRRLNNYHKLVKEESRNTASLADQRNRGRQLSKTIKQHMELKRKLVEKK